MAKDQIVMVGTREVMLTNLDKVWWDEWDITKGEVVQYFAEVAPYLLPHLKDRPLVLTRYPNGYLGKSFYQKNVPAHAPTWVKTVPLPSEKRVINYLLAEDVADLIWLANQAAFEIHPFLSRIQSIDKPDFAVFDLDPMENSVWDDVRRAALTVRAALKHFGLRAYPKTSGGDGLQIFLPLINEFTYEDVRSFTLAISRHVHELMPDKTTLIRSPAQRGGRLYLDYLQNVKGKTLVSVYAIRPKPMATVSTPILWSEIEEDTARNQDFTLRNVRGRLTLQGDLFKDCLTDKQDISIALRELGM